MRRAAESVFGSLSSYRIGIDTYDQDKLGLGPLMIQQAGSGESAWAGPFSPAVVRPFEFSTSMSVAYPWAIQWSNTIDWIFLADVSTAAATRKIGYATFNRTTGVLSLVGFITITPPSGTNHTVRGLRMTYDKHTAGPVAVSGTAVTGTSTTWQTDRACVGNRIGFGSTDPTQISTWYEISAIGSDTSITLTSSAGTISAGTAYVIEDLRAVVVSTAATATNGGLFIAKGLRVEAFSAAGTTIAAATTVDNIRATYWLKDAATETNTTANGCGIESSGTLASKMVWVGNGTTTQQLFKYNIRAALTLTSGADTSAFRYATAVSATLTGTASQANNGRCATLGHGPGSGSECYYFTTTTRVYRTKALSTVTTGDTTFISGGDVMTEVPPGGTATFGASSLMNSIEYASAIDKLIIAVNATTTPFRSYVTAYNTAGSQFDRVFGLDNRQIDQGTADSGLAPTPSMTGAAYSLWSEGGVLYIATIGATAILNRVYAIPLSADWEYSATTTSYVLSPRIACDQADRFRRAWVNDVSAVGGATGKNLGLSTEAWRVSYRTSGISDNSGSWTLLNATGDMAGAAGAAYVQFKLEFRTFGSTHIATRICNVGVAYDDTNTDSHYQFSATQSSAASKQFAWRFSTAFGGTVPTLRIRLYDAVTGSLLVDDNSASPTGTWEKSTNDGSTYGSYNTTDKANDTTYIRFTPLSLADSIKVSAVLTLNA